MQKNNGNGGAKLKPQKNMGRREQEKIEGTLKKNDKERFPGWELHWKEKAVS